MTWAAANTVPVEDFPTMPIKELYDQIVQNKPEFRKYFPDYDASYCPPRKFFWAIYLTLHRVEAQELIEEA